MQWRARFNLPALLSRCNEKTIVSLATAINGGLAVVILSAIAWATNLPLVFPALGPSVFIMFSSPFSPAAAPRSVILGHLLGMGCGRFCWYVVGAATDLPVTLERGDWTSILSASAALALTALLLIRFDCPHPPACASALVIALGGVMDWLHIAAMLFGIGLVTTQAVWLGRLFGIRTPLWRAPHTG